MILSNFPPHAHIHTHTNTHTHVLNPSFTWVEPGILCPPPAAASRSCTSDSNGSSPWILSRLFEPSKLLKICGDSSVSSSSEWRWQSPSTAGTSCAPCSSSRPPADTAPPPPRHVSWWWSLWGGSIATIAAGKQKRKHTFHNTESVTLKPSSGDGQITKWSLWNLIFMLFMACCSMTDLSGTCIWKTSLKFLTDSNRLKLLTLFWLDPGITLILSV